MTITQLAQQVIESGTIEKVKAHIDAKPAPPKHENVNDMFDRMFSGER